MSMPDLVAASPQLNSLGFDRVIGVVEQAELHPMRMLREEGEVGARSVPGGAEGSRLARPDPDQSCLKGDTEHSVPARARGAPQPG